MPAYDTYPILTNKLALITGASSGIGAAFAKAYAASGCNVVLLARRADRLRALAETLQAKHAVQAHVLVADLAQTDAVAAVTTALSERNLAPDILVNNAGYSIARRFTNVEWDAQRDFLQVQIMSATGLCHALLPHMMKQGWGRIINVSSITAFSPGAAGHTLYPAAKGFLLRMSQSLAAEVREQGVHVTAICPGQTTSEFTDANGTKELIARSGMWTQSAQAVVRLAIKASESGHETAISGWHNRLAVWAMTLLPDAWVAALIRPKAAQFTLDE